MMCDYCLKTADLWIQEYHYNRLTKKYNPIYKTIPGSGYLFAFCNTPGCKNPYNREYRTKIKVNYIK